VPIAQPPTYPPVFQRETPAFTRQVLFQREASEAVRRVLNITVAATGVVLVAPVMAVIALLIKLTSRGSPIFTQVRVGIDRRGSGDTAANNRRRLDYGGKPFIIYKFRTMIPQEDNTTEVWASPEDSRVTAVGRILRQYRLDELPQLINVLRGDMDVVGPRPEQPTIFARLREEIDRYEERQRVRPGITGWAQINQSYDSCVEDVRRKLAYDLEYIHRQSAFEDLRIMLRTLPAMLFKQGGW
jgi:lipopolysaccharide/colanic/teichoic acid biosynthesis glycosyltransferase